MNDQTPASFQRFLDDLKKRHPDWFNTVDNKQKASGEETELWDGFEE